MTTSPACSDLSLQELCDLAGVSERTVRYYIAQGLLPSPGVGRGVRYGAEHLARLRLIRRYQDAFLPLAEIRARLERMSPTEILAGEGPISPTTSPAQAASPPPPAAAPAPPAPPDSAAAYVAHLLGSAQAAYPLQRSTWERIALSPDVEIHVRRPLTRAGNRKVEHLLTYARDLLQEEEK